MCRRALLCLLLVIAVGCGGGDHDGADVTPTTVAPTTVTTAAPTTTVAPTTVPPPVLATGGRPSGQEAVSALLAAWAAGDRVAAAEVADATVVDALFAVAPSRTENRGCNEAAPGAPQSCVFRLATGDELQVRATPRPAGYAVDHVLVSPP